MNPLTQFKRILILPILIALPLVALASLRVGYIAAREHRFATVEQDRRGHGRGLRRVPGGRASSIRRTRQPPSTTPSSRSTVGMRPQDSTITAPTGSLSRLRGHRGRLPHASLLLLVVPGSPREPRRRHYAEALSPANLDGCTADGGAGTAGSLTAANEVIYNRTTGPNPDGRMTPIGVKHAVRDAAARTGRVAADSAVRCRRRRRGSDDVSRFILGESRSVPARPAPVAPEPRVGRRLRRDQAIRRSDQQGADRRSRPTWRSSNWRT